MGMSKIYDDPISELKRITNAQAKLTGMLIDNDMCSLHFAEVLRTLDVRIASDGVVEVRVRDYDSRDGVFGMQFMKDVTVSEYTGPSFIGNKVYQIYINPEVAAITLWVPVEPIAYLVEITANVHKAIHLVVKHGEVPEEMRNQVAEARRLKDRHTYN